MARLIVPTYGNDGYRSKLSGGLTLNRQDAKIKLSPLEGPKSCFCFNDSRRGWRIESCAAGDKRNRRVNDFGNSSRHGLFTLERNTVRAERAKRIAPTAHPTTHESRIRTMTMILTGKSTTGRIESTINNMIPVCIACPLNGASWGGPVISGARFMPAGPRELDETASSSKPRPLSAKAGWNDQGNRMPR